MTASVKNRPEQAVDHPGGSVVVPDVDTQVAARARSSELGEDIDLDSFETEERPTPHDFVWLKVPRSDVWGLDAVEVRADPPPAEQVVPVQAVTEIVEEVLRRQGRHDHPRHQPVDRNLITTGEFARAVDIAESTVFDLLKRGLPSTKTRGLGRRILKEQAIAWLVAGGPDRSRTAKKLAKQKGNVRG